MSQRKTYQSISFIQLDTYVVVNGQKVLIQFRGGALQPRKFGKFSTSNQNIIAAMDKDSGNGTSFKCVYAEDFPDEIQPEVLMPAPEPTPVKEVPVVEAMPEEEKEVVVNPYTSVPGIKTVQAARQYLADNFSIPLSKIPNGAAVKKQAEANKVKFIDLP